MFTAAFFFLGIAGFIVAASFCLSIGRRTAQHVEVDLAALRAASAWLSTAGTKPVWDRNAKWQEIKATWMGRFARCQETAILKRKAMYSWARTLALCAVLCVVGVLLESEFDQSISLRGILAGFTHSRPAATAPERPRSCPRGNLPSAGAAERATTARACAVSSP